jgi:glycosyltransferase involved in cell wall biosynthesis
MTRVLFLNLYAALGGAENALLHLLGSLDRKRCTPLVVIGSHGPLVAEARLRGAEVRVVPFPAPSLWWLAAPWIALSELRAALAIRRIASETGTRVLHVSDVLGLLLALPARLLGVRIVYQVNYLGGWPRRALLSLVAARAVERVLVFSNAQRDEVRARTFGLADRIAVVPPGLGATAFETPARDQARAALGVPADRRAIGMLGRFDHSKGHGTFLAAAARLVETRADLEILVGGGPLNAEALPHVAACGDWIRSEIRRRGLEGRVRLLGWVPRAAELLAALDVLVYPSEAEPFGMVVVEALAVGTPVVVADSGGPPEIVEGGRCGLVFETGDAEALARQVERLLGDAELCQALADSGRTRARTAFTSERYARDLEAVYERVA